MPLVITLPLVPRQLRLGYPSYGPPSLPGRALSGQRPLAGARPALRRRVGVAAAAAAAAAACHLARRGAGGQRYAAELGGRQAAALWACSRSTW